MSRLTDRLNRGRALCLLLAGILAALILTFTLPMPPPAGDSSDYLGGAHNLLVRGTYAVSPDGLAGDRLPGREPGYSAVVALSGIVIPGLGQAVTGCVPVRPECAAGFRPLIGVNVLLILAAALLTGRCCRQLGGPAGGLWAASLYLLLNLHIYKDAKYAISDFLALALVALVMERLAAALLRGGVWRWLGCGLALAALGLTKGLYQPYAVLLAGGLGLSGLVAGRRCRPVDAGAETQATAGGQAGRMLPVACWQRSRWALLGGALCLALPLLVVNGGWAWRNLQQFGVTSDDRGAIALSTREVFNEMTAAEHLAAWVWWTRGPGNGLAKRWFAPEVWKRHEWYEPNGFYDLGQYKRHEARMQEARAAQPDATPAQLQKAVSRLAVRDILQHPAGYLSTLPVLFYRGLWCDEFILIGFPCLVVLLIRLLRRQTPDGTGLLPGAFRWSLLLVLTPGLWSLLLYPAVSLNIPRYQITALPLLALVAGLVLPGLLVRLRRRFAG